MGQGHPRGKHQGGLITVPGRRSASASALRHHCLRNSLEFRLAIERAHLHSGDIAARQLVKLLRGASTADMPNIEQPTKFAFVTM